MCEETDSMHTTHAASLLVASGVEELLPLLLRAAPAPAALVAAADGEQLQTHAVTRIDQYVIHRTARTA